MAFDGRTNDCKYLLNNQLTEFKIICKNESGELLSDFDVRAIVLKKHPVFEAMLEAKLNEETEKQLIISGWKRQVVEKFIEFLYNDRVDDIDEVVDDLLLLASQYMVLPLKELCGDAIALRLDDADKMISVFDLAVKYDVKSLKFACSIKLPAKVGTFTVEQLCHILRNGQDLHALAEMCEKQLVCMITDDNVFDLLALAQDKSCAALYHGAALHVGKNWVALNGSHRKDIVNLSNQQLRVVVSSFSCPVPSSDAFADQICQTCSQTYQPGTECGCGTVKCTGCIHAAHAGVCPATLSTARVVHNDYGKGSSRVCYCYIRYTNGTFSIG